MKEPGLIKAQASLAMGFIGIIIAVLGNIEMLYDVSYIPFCDDVRLALYFSNIFIGIMGYCMADFSNRERKKVEFPPLSEAKAGKVASVIAIVVQVAMFFNALSAAWVF